MRFSIKSLDGRISLSAALVSLRIRRRQNLYAKRVAALQRVLDLQRLVHNWVRPHHGLEKNTTPAMAMGYCDRPITVHELLTHRGFASLIR